MSVLYGFDAAGVKRIVAAVRKSESAAPPKSGRFVKTGSQPNREFYLRLTEESEDDPGRYKWTLQTWDGYFLIDTFDPVVDSGDEYTAVEANLTPDLTGRIVRATFEGYDDASEEATGLEVYRFVSDQTLELGEIKSLHPCSGYVITVPPGKDDPETLVAVIDPLKSVKINMEVGDVITFMRMSEATGIAIQPDTGGMHFRWDNTLGGASNISKLEWVNWVNAHTVDTVGRDDFTIEANTLGIADEGYCNGLVGAGLEWEWNGIVVSSSYGPTCDGIRKLIFEHPIDGEPGGTSTHTVYFDTECAGQHTTKITGYVRIPDPVPPPVYTGVAPWISVNAVTKEISHNGPGDSTTTASVLESYEFVPDDTLRINFKKPRFDAKGHFTGAYEDGHVDLTLTVIDIREMRWNATDKQLEGRTRTIAVPYAAATPAWNVLVQAEECE